MKKNYVIFLALIFALFFSCTAYGESMDESLNIESLNQIGVSCDTNTSQVAVTIDIADYKGYKAMLFDSPYRLVIDIPNATGPLQQQKIDVKSNLVKSVRYAKNNLTTARVVIDTVGKPQYLISEKTGKLTIFVVKPIISGVNYYIENGIARLTLPVLSLSDTSSANKKQYTEKYEYGGKRYTISYKSSLLKLQNKIISIKDSFLKTIEIKNNTANKSTSIIFNTNEKFLFKVSSNKTLKRTEILIQKASSQNRGDEERPSLFDLKEVKYSQENTLDIVDLITDSYANYSVLKLNDEKKLEIILPNVKAPVEEQVIPVNSGLVSGVRYVQAENNTAKVTIELISEFQYHAVENSDRLSILISVPGYKNLSYISSGDRKCLLLKGIKLTDGSDGTGKLYTEAYDETGKIYSITFPNNVADIGSGEMPINDDFLDSIKIIQNESEPTTSIIFYAKDSFVYNTIARSVTGDTAISVLKPAAEGERLVVIDAGHGGSEPGAISGNVQEKDLNLDIALKLNSILKSKGIRTYMTREDDSYIGLYERAYIANNLKASLFLCIHNNAFNSSYNGTETLYTPGKPDSSGFTGKSFAQIIQDCLTKGLGTFDRKIKSRPELVVLKATQMPAALAEVAFITNKGDREKLLVDEFRMKAAEALSDSVIEALGNIN